LILCAEKTAEHVELLQLETSGIRLLSILPNSARPLLEAKLHEAIRLAREQIAAHGFQGWRESDEHRAWNYIRSEKYENINILGDLMKNSKYRIYG